MNEQLFLECHEQYAEDVRRVCLGPPPILPLSPLHLLAHKICSHISHKQEEQEMEERADRWAKIDEMARRSAQGDDSVQELIEKAEAVPDVPPMVRGKSCLLLVLSFWGGGSCFSFRLIHCTVQSPRSPWPLPHPALTNQS